MTDGGKTKQTVNLAPKIYDKSLMRIPTNVYINKHRLMLVIKMHVGYVLDLGPIKMEISHLNVKEAHYFILGDG